MSCKMYEMVMVSCEEFYELDRPFEVDDPEDFSEEADRDFFFDGMYGD